MTNRLRLQAQQKRDKTSLRHSLSHAHDTQMTGSALIIRDTQIGPALSNVISSDLRRTTRL